MAARRATSPITGAHSECPTQPANHLTMSVREPICSMPAPDPNPLRVPPRRSKPGGRAPPTAGSSSLARWPRVPLIRGSWRKTDRSRGSGPRREHVRMLLYSTGSSCPGKTTLALAAAVAFSAWPSTTSTNPAPRLRRGASTGFSTPSSANGAARTSCSRAGPRSERSRPPPPRPSTATRAPHPPLCESRAHDCLHLGGHCLMPVRCAREVA